MNPSRREKAIALVAVAAAGLWLLDRVVLAPVWSACKDDREQAFSLQRELFNADQLLRRSDAMERRYARRAAAGVTLPVSQVEGNMIEALERWATEARLSEVSLRPDRRDPVDGVQTIGCRVTAEGTMSSLVRLCWLMENASIPLRIDALRVGSSDSTRDLLSIQLDVSTVCLDPAAQPPTPRENLGVQDR